VKLLSALHKTANKRQHRPTFCASKESVTLQERSQFQRQSSRKTFRRFLNERAACEYFNV